MNTDEILAIARTKLGCLYRWGAEGSDRFDCSGYVRWWLRAIGRALRGDQTAAMLFAMLPRRRGPAPGRLAYWATRSFHVFHVGIVTSVDGAYTWVLGAHGGGSKTKSDEVAIAQNAKVSEKRFLTSGIFGYTSLPGEVEDPALKAEEDERPEEIV